MSVTRISQDDDAPYRLRIRDDVSRSVICEIRMTANQFADAITGSLQTGIDVEWMNLDRIGKIREVKEEVVMIPSKRDGVAMAAINIYEVDGWVGRLEDAFSPDRQVRHNCWRVQFARYVDPVKDGADVE